MSFNIVHDVAIAKANEMRDTHKKHDMPVRRLEDLAPAAQRELREADARRAEYDKRAAAMPREIAGRGGREPGRYGDWEVKGIASDF